eukprot:TRINITY_DN1432_c0_g1_i1.p1 TRINITY_DN1432_c0_g1~~TRINITY_DN1432_c0_g1_i1.p1  ORF type:complete len:509 (-),score=192.37 TRINITY_DN1432_c0_g1_i1:62-1588(-)
MSQTVFESLEDQCTCWICFEIFKDPITLPCSHTLCKSCTEKVVVTHGSCPFCRKTFEPPIPKVNPEVERLCQNLYEEKKEMMDIARNQWVEQEQSFLLNIPFELQVEILLHLPAKEAGRFGSICKQTRAITNDSWLWREFCQREFPFVSVARYGRSWKNAFVAQSGVQKGWNAGKAGDFKVTAYRGHTNYVNCFKNYKDVTVSGSADHTIKIWRGTEGSPLKDLTGHNGVISCLEFNEARIVSGSDDKTVKIWDATRGNLLNSIDSANNVTCIAFNDSSLVVGQNAPSFSIYDVRTAALVKTLAPAIQSVSQVEIQGDYIYVCGTGGVRVYDIRKPAFAYRDWDLPSSKIHVDGQKILVATNGKISELDPSNANRTDWENNTNTPIVELQKFGNTLAALTRDEVQIWNTNSKVKTNVLKKDAAVLNCMRLGPNKVVVGSADNTIKVWELSSGKKLYNLLGGSLQVRANNPNHPRLPGISGIEIAEGQIIASLASMLRVYDFDTFHPSE